MRERTEMMTWFPAFAALTPTGGAAAHLDDYKRWLDRVADNEFADEFVKHVLPNRAGFSQSMGGISKQYMKTFLEFIDFFNLSLSNHLRV